jgi:hypothetical protein
METHEIRDGCEYVVGDAEEVLEQYEEQAAAVFLDDAWASPERVKRLDTMYKLHAFSDELAERTDGELDESTTSIDIVDAAHDALMEGGWLVSDAQDWVAPHLMGYLVETWGDASQAHEEFEGGGYRKTGGVTFLDDGEPSRQTKGTFLSRAGYFVLFAHKGQTDRKTDAAARQLADQPHIKNKYGWQSTKPIEPYTNWVEGLVEPGELILVPCAGSAPAALAAERVFGEDARYVCVDKEEGAFEAFKQRREDEL